MHPKYYKILDCPDQKKINQQILSSVNSMDLLNSDDFWNPVDPIEFVKQNSLLVNYLKSIGLALRDVAVTVGKTKNCCPLHIDTPPARFKLNWPVLNTSDTYTRWFKSTDSTVDKYTNSWGGTVFSDHSCFNEIEKVELLHPCLIDASVPHDVLIGNNATFPRIGLQCIFFKEPTSLYE